MNKQTFIYKYSSHPRVPPSPSSIFRSLKSTGLNGKQLKSPFAAEKPKV